jgi:hypothetical protein
LGFHLFITIRPKKDTECNRKSFGLVWKSVFRFCCSIPAFDLSPVLQGHVITEFFMIPPDFVGQPQRGEMFIVWCWQKVVTAPAGRHIHVQMPLLTELASFSCDGYIHSAPLALPRCLTHKIRQGQNFLIRLVICHYLKTNPLGSGGV